MLENVKKALRITHNELDDEIGELIDIAEADLLAVGVKFDNDKAMRRQAIRFYCQANFGKDANYEKYNTAYERLKTLLVMGVDESVRGDLAYRNR